MPAHTVSGYRCVPTAANGASLADGGSGSWSSWAQLSASLGQASQVVGLMCRLNTSSQSVEIEIGVGASGFETAIANIQIGYGSEMSGVYFLKFPVNVASSDRISWRTRFSSGIGATHYAKLLYIPSQESTIEETASNGVTSGFQNGIALSTGGSAWSSGSWVQVLASAATDLGLYGLALFTHGAFEFEVDIGIGGSGSESVIWTVRFTNSSTFFPHHGLTPPGPVRFIPSGSRIAARARDANGSQNITVYPNLVELPL